MYIWRCFAGKNDARRLDGGQPSGFGQEIAGGRFNVAGGAGRTGAAVATAKAAQQDCFEGNVFGCRYVQVGAELRTNKYILNNIIYYAEK